jgi:hypothetical protein
MAILVAAVAFSTSGTIAQDKVVWSLGGSDNHTSEVISTTGPIEVRWRATGGQFQMSALDGTTSTTIVSGPPQERVDATEPPMVGGITTFRGGDIKFEIKATGPWFVRAVQK